MKASFRAELMRLARRPAMWVILAVWTALSVVFGYVFPYFSYRGALSATGAVASASEQVLSEALPAELVPAAVQGFPLFAGALALLIGVLATGGEYGWNTVKVVLTIGPRRVSVVIGKLLALAVVMLPVVLTTFRRDGGASLLVASVARKPVAWPSIGALVTGIGGGWLVVGMWCLAGGAPRDPGARHPRWGWASAWCGRSRWRTCCASSVRSWTRWMLCSASCPAPTRARWSPPSASRCTANPVAPRGSPTSWTGRPRRWSWLSTWWCSRQPRRC